VKEKRPGKLILKNQHHTYGVMSEQENAKTPDNFFSTFDSWQEVGIKDSL